MKKIAGITIILVCVSVVMAADDSLNAVLQSIPGPVWLKGLLAVILGTGVVGALVRKIIGKTAAKWIDWAIHAMKVIKKFASAISKIKPILKDSYVIEKYGNLLSEYNQIVDEVEVLCNEGGIVKTQNFLEKYKVELIDHEKVMKALKSSTLIKSGENAINKMVDSAMEVK